MDLTQYRTKFLSCLSIERSCSVSTIKDYNSELLRFSGFLEAKKTDTLELITIPLLREYLYISKENRKLCQTSISKIIAIIKSFFNYLEEEEIIGKNPSRKIKSPKKKNKIPAVITRSEFDMLISSIDFCPSIYRKNTVRDKLLISMLFYTGIRRNELINLDWNNLNLENSTLFIRSGKGDRDRIIPIHRNLQPLIESYLNLRLPLKNNALFIGLYGRRLCIYSFTMLLKTHLTTSGLAKKGYTAHSLQTWFCYSPNPVRG